MMLVRSDEAPSEAEHVFDNVYASGSQDLLRDLVQSGESADRVRLYAGYAGWVTGQLDAEIRRGSWTIVAAAEKYVFSSDPGGVWERLVPPLAADHRATPDAPTASRISDSRCGGHQIVFVMLDGLRIATN